jgi:hypothetical protein
MTRGQRARLLKSLLVLVVLGIGWLGLKAFAGGAFAAPPAANAAGSFALETFFDGSSASQGAIETGYVSAEPFTAGFSGTATGGDLVLDERFHFAKGDRLQRWRLNALPGGRYAGTVETERGDGVLAAPVPVTGYRTTDGAVLTYEGYAPGGGSMLLHFRHVMQAQRDGTVLNTVGVSKFGIPVAGARVVFSKPPAAARVGQD